MEKVHKCCDDIYYKELHISGKINLVIDLLCKICKDNNMAKASIFKKNGAKPLLKLLDSCSVPIVMFLLKMSEDNNITGYISADIYMEIMDKYINELDEVTKYFKENPINQISFGGLTNLWSDDDINRKYIFLIMMNHFWLNLFSKKFLYADEKIGHVLEFQKLITERIS